MRICCVPYHCFSLGCLPPAISLSHLHFVYVTYNQQILMWDNMFCAPQHCGCVACGSCIESELQAYECLWQMKLNSPQSVWIFRMLVYVLCAQISVYMRTYNGTLRKIQGEYVNLGHEFFPPCHLQIQLANWIGHTLRRNCLLKQVIEGKITGEMGVTRRRGRRRKKLLDDLKDRRGYSHLKEEALDRTMWRNRFGGDFGPVVR